MALKVLILDDAPDIRHLISEILQDEGYQCSEFGESDTALAGFKEEKPDLIILDIWLQGSNKDGLELLIHFKEESPEIPIVMISGHADIETAVKAIKLGAYDFIEKPFKADHLLLMVERALDAARLRRENKELRQLFSVDTDLIGVSKAVNQLRNVIERVSVTDSRVLISGPAGAGKEVIARLLHRSSLRKNFPFVVLNCATMAPENIEIELFGKEKSAEKDQIIGTFEQAHGGTLLLDEVGDMPLETQGKIVRILQKQRFARVGGTHPINVDVRVIASTNHDLVKEIRNGHFREDLYYRLNVVPIVVPPLRERPEDIPHLIKHFMNEEAELAGLPERKFAEDAMAVLQSYDWPGNIRQLRNVIDWVLIMAVGGADESVRAEGLPPEFLSQTPTTMRWEEGSEVMRLALRDARELFERQYLKLQISRFGGNISKTAEFVGMERSALHRKLRSLGINSGIQEEKSDNLSHFHEETVLK
ncbi:MAG: sigma-54 dependent transcriptional regulator [Pseudomonadota bacterium]|nr:sigma-54 dependent transcriptional regulator [Pseudomonadota bacterium]